MPGRSILALVSGCDVFQKDIVVPKNKKGNILDGEKKMIKVEFPSPAMLPASSRPSMAAEKWIFTYVYQSEPQQNCNSNYSAQMTSSFSTISACTFEGTVTFPNKKATEVT